MLVEAVNKRLRVRLASGAVELRPGEPVELPDEDARKLLVQARGKVREVQPVTVDLLVGEVVTWHDERGLIRLTLVDRGKRWAWVEGASREGWTSVYTAALPCQHCGGSKWWWGRVNTTSLTIQCVQCHPPTPDWTRERQEIEELAKGLSDPTVVSLTTACTSATIADDYSTFLVQKERLMVYVGGLFRGTKG